MPQPRQPSAASRESSDGARLARRLAQAIRAAIDDRWIERGCWIDTRCLVELDGHPVLITIDHGRVDVVEAIPLLGSWDFAVRGSAAAWTSLWQDPPPPGWHDLFALAKRGELRMEGNLHPLLANLQYFKDLLALARSPETG